MQLKIKNSDLSILETKQSLIIKNKVPDGFATGPGQEYQWIWLAAADVENLLAIRNADHVTSNMRNASKITNEEHLNFLKNYASLQRVDFVLLDKNRGAYVGGMSVSLTLHGFELGKYIGNVDYLGRGIAFPMSISFISYVRANISEIDDIRAVTRQDNYKNINLNFRLGFKILTSLEKDYWLMGMK